jgi:hypothetical protein
MYVTSSSIQILTLEFSVFPCQKWAFLGKVCVVVVYVFFKVWWHYATFFNIYYFNIHSYNTIIYSFIICLGPTSCIFIASPLRSLLVVASRESSSGLPYSKPTLYKLSYATPLWCGGLCLHSQRRVEDQGPDGTDHLRVRADRQIVVLYTPFFLHVVLTREKLKAR